MRTIVLIFVLVPFVPSVAGQRAMPSHATAAPRAPLPREVARVNGVPLMSDRLEAAVNRLIPLESFHRGVTAEKMAAVRTKALQGLIDEELEYQAGMRLAIRATTEEVDRVVAQAQKRFATRDAFEERLRASGATVGDLRREVQRSIIVQKTVDRVVTSRCEVSMEEARRYFAANPDRFVVPEQLHVYAITIGVDPSAPAAAWAEARAHADTVHRQLLGGAPFEGLARKHSTDPSKATGGDMGFIHRGSLNDEFERALRSLAPGGISEVVKSLYGYHIVRLAGIRPPQKKAFADVAPELRRNLTAQRCDEVKGAWIARMRATSAIVQ